MKNPLLRDKFLINAQELNQYLNIVPLLFGSLGLQDLLDEELHCDDIDILIPSLYLNDNWDSFKSLLEELGYTLIDLHEHTFTKDGVSYSYANIEGLNEFVGITEKEITIQNENGIQFYTLNLAQFLLVYKKSSLDGYRANKKENKDLIKIKLIERKLKD